MGSVPQSAIQTAKCTAIEHLTADLTYIYDGIMVAYNTIVFAT